jgi:phospholipid/cholesterol/gamma-HCH transport system permease protein
MSGSPVATLNRGARSGPGRAVEALGAWVGGGWDACVRFIESVGGTVRLTFAALLWIARGIFVPRQKLGRPAIAEQMVRIGVRSIGIVMLVEVFIGSILALQLAPTLESYGQIQMVANVVAIAIVRELGPLITAIVLSGFAGASIAAEIGAMVEGEEIKALRAHAINPIRFLIVPRLLATTLMIVGLAVIADVIGVIGGFLTSWMALGITPETYFQSTQAALVVRDFLTGLVKAAVFGAMIAMIACHAGLTVRGGAVGVGNATTQTVVKSIVAIIGMDAVFTAVFYAFGL